MSRDFEVLTTKRLRSAEKLVKHQRFQSPLKIASTLAPPDSTAPEIAVAALSHSSGATAVTMTATSERTGTKYRPCTPHAISASSGVKTK
jgi:hypothetical protein